MVLGRCVSFASSNPCTASHVHSGRQISGPNVTPRRSLPGLAGIGSPNDTLRLQGLLGIETREALWSYCEAVCVSMANHWYTFTHPTLGSPFRQSPGTICTVLLDPRNPLLRSERTQGLAAGPVYGRAKCLPILGAFKT